MVSIPLGGVTARPAVWSVSSDTAREAVLAFCKEWYFSRDCKITRTEDGEMAFDIIINTTSGQRFVLAKYVVLRPIPYEQETRSWPERKGVPMAGGSPPKRASSARKAAYVRVFLDHEED